MDRYEGSNDVNELVLYVSSMKAMTFDKTHMDEVLHVACLLILLTYLDSGSSRSRQNLGWRDSAISGNRWRLSLLLSITLHPCLVDIRQTSDAKSFVVFLLIFSVIQSPVHGDICRPDFSLSQHVACQPQCPRFHHFSEIVFQTFTLTLCLSYDHAMTLLVFTPSVYSSLTCCCCFWISYMIMSNVSCRM